MAVESAKQAVQVSVGKDLSTLTIGGTKVEVSSDTSVVVYANEVQTKPAATPGEGGAQGTQISISADFNTVVLNGIRIERAAEGHLIVHSNGAVKLIPFRPNDTAAKATPEIGAIESAGAHKGEIYGGIFSKEYGGDNKPIWLSAAPKVMDHYKAAAWAQGKGGSLPTRKQGDYLTTLKISGGAFTEIFNRGTSFPAGYVWLAESYTTIFRDYAWCQRLSDGVQGDTNWDVELPVLCVRR